MGLNIDKIAKMKKEYEERERQRAELFVKLKEGDNIFRFLPIEDDFAIMIRRHRVGDKLVRCLRSYGEDRDCPVCKVVEDLKDAGNVEQATMLYPKERYYSLVVYRDDQKKERIGILAYGFQIWNQLANLVLDPEWGDFTDYKNGYAINIKREGTGLNTKYVVVPRVKKEVPKEIYEEWLKKAPNIREILKEPTRQSIIEALEGVIEREEIEELNNIEW